MKKFSFTLIFSLFLNFLFAQTTSIDSVPINQKDKVHVGFYFMPTFSFNHGKMVAPSFYDGADCNCGYSFQDLKESGDLGYSLGFEIETKKITKRMSLSSGINLDFFQYSGTANQIGTSYFIFPYIPGDPIKINYSYKDYFLAIPFLLHHLLFYNELNRMNVLLGVSGGIFLKESNSGGINYQSTNEFEEEGNPLAVFGNTGIDYFYGRKTLWNVGFRITSQLNTTPKGRRLAFAGIKMGIFF